MYLKNLVGSLASFFANVPSVSRMVPSCLTFKMSSVDLSIGGNVVHGSGTMNNWILLIMEDFRRILGHHHYLFIPEGSSVPPTDSPRIY
jgi:hypothetical protein